MKLTKEVNQSTGGGNSFLKIGIFEARILAINPTREKLNKILGIDAKDDQKEIEYVSEKDGKDKVKIVFWVEDVLTGWKTKLEFDLTNEEAATKAGNPIWANQVGDIAKVAKDDLQKWFMEFYKSKDDKTVIAEKNFRKTKVGEAALYEFMRSWFSRKTSTGVTLNWYSPNTDILLDTKKLFRGVVTELTDQLTAPEEENITGTVVLAAWVDSYDKDGELKYAQKIWPYKTLPGYMMKKVNLSMQQNSWDSDKVTKKFKDEILGDYGIKGSFQLCPLKEFNADEHLAATNEVIKHEPDAPITSLDY